MSNRNFALPHSETSESNGTVTTPNILTSNNQQPDPPQSKSGLPVWAWILIVIGIILFVALIVILIWYLINKNKKPQVVHKETTTKVNSALTAPTVRV